MCQALFYSNNENGHSPDSHGSHIQVGGEGETEINTCIICLFVIRGREYTGQWEEQVGGWGKIRSSVLDTLGLKHLRDNQVKIQSRSWINV